MKLEDRKRSVDLDDLSKERAAEIQEQLTQVIEKITEGVHDKIKDRCKTTETRVNNKCKDLVQDIETKLNEYLNVYGLEVEPKIKLQMVLEYKKK